MRRFNCKGPCRNCGARTSYKLMPAPGIPATYTDGSISYRASCANTEATGLARVPCRGCGAFRWAAPVFGAYKLDRKCDARCMGATGHNCECQCGGENHGAAHDACAV